MVESEKDLERKLCKDVEFKLGGVAWKWFSIHISGLPDRIVLLPGGRVFFVELKTTGKYISPIQRSVHKKLQKLGFRVEVVDSSEQIDKLIEDYEPKRDSI